MWLQDQWFSNFLLTYLPERILKNLHPSCIFMLPPVIFQCTFAEHHFQHIACNSWYFKIKLLAHSFKVTPKSLNPIVLFLPNIIPFKYMWPSYSLTARKFTLFLLLLLELMFSFPYFHCSHRLLFYCIFSYLKNLYWWLHHFSNYIFT